MFLQNLQLIAKSITRWLFSTNHKNFGILYLTKKTLITIIFCFSFCYFINIFDILDKINTIFNNETYIEYTTNDIKDSKMHEQVNHVTNNINQINTDIKIIPENLSENPNLNPSENRLDNNSQEKTINNFLDEYDDVIIAGLLIIIVISITVYLGGDTGSTDLGYLEYYSQFHSIESEANSLLITNYEGLSEGINDNISQGAFLDKLMLSRMEDWFKDWSWITRGRR